MGKNLEIGEYGHGTVRSCDIANTLAGMLRQAEHDDAMLLCELDEIAGNEDESCELDEIAGNEDESCYAYYVQSIFDEAYAVLQGYAPPFCHVGMCEVDGSSLGVWFSREDFDSACWDGEVMKISDLSELDDMSADDVAGYDYIAVISDHGNVALYPIKVTVGPCLLDVV
jgi:hypothetical protein